MGVASQFHKFTAIKKWRVKLKYSRSKIIWGMIEWYGRAAQCKLLLIGYVQYMVDIPSHMLYNDTRKDDRCGGHFKLR